MVDESGVYYRIPICVINDPLNFNADYVNEKLKNKEAPSAQMIKVSTKNSLTFAAIEVPLGNRRAQV